MGCEAMRCTATGSQGGGGGLCRPPFRVVGPLPLVRQLLVLKQPKLAMSDLYSDGSGGIYPVPLVPAVAALLKDDPEPAIRADAATALGYTASIKFGDLKLAQAVLKEQPAWQRWPTRIGRSVTPPRSRCTLRTRRP